MRGETEPGPTDRTPEPSQPGPRRDVGGAASSRRHPPHVTEQVEGTEAQDAPSAAGDTPALPANAHGEDRSEMTKQAEVDDESMYDNRPAEDKSRPPSSPRVP